MLNLEILRISLIRRAPGGMGAPLRSLATFPASPREPPSVWGRPCAGHAHPITPDVSLGGAGHQAGISSVCVQLCVMCLPLGWLVSDRVSRLRSTAVGPTGGGGGSGWAQNLP